MLTLGQTGVDTVGGDCLIDNLGMAGCRNNFLSNQNLVTAGAVRAFGQTGVLTVRCNISVDNGYMDMVQLCDRLSLGAATSTAGEGLDTLFLLGGLLGDHTIVISMTCSGDFSAAFGLATAVSAGQNCFVTNGLTAGFHLCGGFLHGVADSGDFSAALGITAAVSAGQSCLITDGLTTGLHLLGGLVHGMAGSGDCSAAFGLATAVSTAINGFLTGGLTSGIHLCNGFLHGVADCGNGFGVAVVVAASASEGLHTVSLTAHCSGDGLSEGMPLAVSIGVGVVSIDSANGSNVGAVCILQLCSADRNLNVFSILLLQQLIADCIRCITQDDLTGAGADNRCAVFGSISITQRRVNDTINLNVCVIQICLGTGMLHTGSISNSLELPVRGAAVVAPLIQVVDIDATTAGQSTGSTLFNVELNTGQNVDILLDGDFTAGLDTDSHVVVQGQVIVSGIQAGDCNRHRNGRHGYSTIQFHNQAVGAAIIPLGNGTTAHAEHGTAGTNEGQAQAIVIGSNNLHGDVGIALFNCTGFQSQRNLNILDIVLAHGEDTVTHTGGLAAATVVHELETLVDGGIALGSDRTGTGNEAPGIQRTTAGHGDGRAFSHVNAAGGTGGRTGGLTCLAGNHLAGEAQLTVDGNVSAFCHVQSTVEGGLGVSSTADIGFCGVDGVCIVKRNQQGNATGDGVVACRQGCVVHQNNGLVGCRNRCVHSSIPVVVQTGVIHQIPGGAACKDCLHSHIRSRLQGIGSITGDDGTIFLDPAQELVAGLGSSYQGCTLSGSDLLLMAGRNGSAAHSNSTAVAVENEFNIGLSGCCNQAEVAQLQSSSGTAKTAVGLNFKLYRCTGLHQLGEGTGVTGGSTINLEAVVAGNSVVKGQLRLLTRLIGDGDRVGLLAENTTLCRDGQGTVGVGAGVRTIRNVDSAVQKIVRSRKDRIHHHVQDDHKTFQSFQSGEAIKFRFGQTCCSLLQGSKIVHSGINGITIFGNNCHVDIIFAHVLSQAIELDDIVDLILNFLGSSGLLIRNHSYFSCFSCFRLRGYDGFGCMIMVISICRKYLERYRRDNHNHGQYKR